MVLLTWSFEYGFHLEKITTNIFSLLETSKKFILFVFPKTIFIRQDQDHAQIFWHFARFIYSMESVIEYSNIKGATMYQARLVTRWIK